MSTLKAKQFHLIEDMDISALTLAIVERVEGAVTKVTNLFRTWSRRSLERRQLAQMSEHMLNDIGMTRHELAQEINKFFWQK